MSERSSLEEITIRGLGVIEDAKLEFNHGFTVLTGETGAGKTMVLTALALVLGGKADNSLVRKGRERLIASATFHLPAGMESEAIEKGANVEDSLLILTRTINSDGKSRAVAGGVSVPASILNDLGERMIEIHGQAASMSITKVSKQREILDRFAGDEFILAFEKYQSAFQTFNNLKSKISALRGNAANREKEVASLREFAAAFSKIKPVAGEMSSLLQDISRLSSVEVLRTNVEEAVQLLLIEDTGVISSLALAKRSLESVSEKDPQISEILNSVTESFFLLSDAGQLANTYLQDLEADPARLDLAQNRRADLNTFLKRFATAGEADDQIREMIERNSRVTELITDLSGGEDRLAQMEEEMNSSFIYLRKNGEELSKVRREGATRLSQAVSEEIHLLSMPHTQFFCNVSSPDYTAITGPERFTIVGADEVAMTLQAHRDGPIVALAKGASGGEMSRVMLALEVVLAQSQPVGTYVFDEVDAGVGGKAAIEVGRRLHELSRTAQVIVVTHLPQVAAWADSHYVVRKDSDGAVSQSDVVNVTGESRIEEIARMLAGHEDSLSARQHAAELLQYRETEVG